MRRFSSRCWMLAAVTAAGSGLAGCANSSTSNTARSATEQMLLANAVDQSLDKVDFRPFAGRTVFLNDKYVDCTDKNYVIASTRHRILAAGGRLVDDAAEADVAVELRAGSVGTDMSESFIGTPEITLPGLMAVPEIKFVTFNTQTATAKLGLVAVNNATHEVLGAGGLTTAVADQTKTNLLGMPLGTKGTLVQDLRRSTTGANAPAPPRLPARVAFVPPAPLGDALDKDGGVKFADGQPLDSGKRVTPASYETDDRDAAGSPIDWDALK